MTVSTVVDHNDYTGNGVTTSFPYTFRIFDKSDLEVSVLDLSENLTVLILDTDYTVTNAGGYSGGNVVLSSPLANGWKISIARSLEATQETDLRNQGKFFAEVHEDAFDKLTMLIQQGFSMFRLALRKPTSIANWYDALGNYIRNLRDPRDPQDAATKNYVDSLATTNFNRTLRVPESFVNQLPTVAGRMNKVLAFDAGGQPITVLPADGTATDVMIELGNDDGFKYIGACESMAELRAIAPSFDGQQILLKGYYADVLYDEEVIYVWNASSTATDDGGRFIKPNSLTTGRWVLKHNSNTFDIRLFGARPNPTYSASQMDIQDVVRKAQTSVGFNAILHFPVPNGWTEAHYLVNYQGFIWTPTWISADERTILHSPFTSDNFGEKPRTASTVNFSEESPAGGAGANAGTRQYRARNKYELLDPLAASMASASFLPGGRFERALFSSVSRGIAVSDLGSYVATASVAGMTVGTSEVTWTNPTAETAAWQGIEMAASAGAEIDAQLYTTGTTGDQIMVGVRTVGQNGTTGGYTTWRIVVGATSVNFYNSGVAGTSYPISHPEDILQATSGCVRIGLRVGRDGTSAALLLNGKPFPVASFSNSVHSFVILASQAARTGLHIQYGHLRQRDFIPYSRPLSIATLGDSITVGARSSTTWPDLLANCAEHLPGLGRMSVDNSKSVSGLRLRTVVQNLASYDFTGRDYVLVNLGINDCQASGLGGIGVFASDIAALAAHIQSFNAVPVFGTVFRTYDLDITGGGNDTTNIQDVPAYVQVLRERCAANGYILAEVNDCMGDNAGAAGGFDANGYMNAWTHDNIHPNTKGQLALASAFASALSGRVTLAATGSLTQFLVPASGFTLTTEADRGLPRVTRTGNVVALSGAISGGAVSSVAATLPAWAKPQASQTYIVYSRDSTTEGTCRVTLRTNRDVVVGSDYKTTATELNITYCI
ncbi:GDSL-type esterase/lipase family protein [Enterobacter cloacae]|uniref:GDSL-type esterase/lipase family protein n=1 Tax=Enterobacter cloacae TaxID=550 RepID=UPI0020764E36|nr:GDSL-type esterase/lipase family protein [Enterobacter cloacae]MCM7404487.1 GDSL-type esterase/lipase family protein [Enterobacter cloacae]